MTELGVQDDVDLDVLRTEVGAVVDQRLPDHVGAVLLLVRDNGDTFEWCGRAFNIGDRFARDLLSCASGTWQSVPTQAPS